jgi:hypothetical protein
MKPTNPKDAVGSTKPGVSAVPSPVLFFFAAAMFEGHLKYGGHNWRAMGVRASIYYNALWRHVSAWWCGENIDPDSGLPHLAKAMACLGILLDAQLNKQMSDDRPPVPDCDWMALVQAATKDLIGRYGEKAKEPFTEANRPTWGGAQKPERSADDNLNSVLNHQRDF